jgi:YVTN family beta-propeller protein
MQNNNTIGSAAARARSVAALWAVLAMGLGAMVRPAEAAPFAYVTNETDGTVSVIDTGAAPPSVTATITVGSGPFGVAVTPDGTHAYVANTGTFSVTGTTVSVIDTATNTVGATIPVGNTPKGVAITPDGTLAYVANGTSDNVSVIRTATNTVVATVAVGNQPEGVAVTPDGTRAYVVNENDGTVSVIATASNTVVATVAVGIFPFGVAVTPDGKLAYVTNQSSYTVSVIATASNTVVATIAVGYFPQGVAITPDGTHAYVANDESDTVSVIATATNTVVGAVPVGTFPFGVAVTPDGKHAYVANDGFGPVSGTVSVIDTATNTVEGATLAVGNIPVAVGIVPPPPGIPFLAFNAILQIQFGSQPNLDAFGLGSGFILSSTAPSINPLTAPVTLQIGTFSITIPAGSFTKQVNGSFTFTGVIGGVDLGARITPTGTLRYAFAAQAMGANLTGTTNPVYVTLTIGGASGATSVTASINQ